MTKQSVIKTLRDASNGILPSGMDLDYGICHLIYYICDRSDIYELFNHNVHNWPKFSGSISYPVPHPTMTPGSAFNTAFNGTMWDDSEYGQNRRDLCTWFADYLENDSTIHQSQ